MLATRMNEHVLPRIRLDGMGLSDQEFVSLNLQNYGYHKAV